MEWLYWPVAVFWAFLEPCSRIKRACSQPGLFHRLFFGVVTFLREGFHCNVKKGGRGRQDADGEITWRAGPVKDRPNVVPRPSQYPASSFYGTIPASRIRLYQSYLERAFALSSTLEFHKDDQRFKGLLAEAAQKDALCPIDLELMRMQYVFADRKQRKLLRSCWAVQVINGGNEEFFPSPQAILAGLFSKNQRPSRPDSESLP
ncbi:MAG: hypothetical protein JRI36_03810 [Deltaproteobacteria bacterium]|nr:hypothetical protein [Deltaproteobacteria bacterium]